MSLESLMPKIEKCGKGYDSCNQCPYASTCDIFDKNALIADCLASLQGKVIAIEEIDWAEIKRLITNYYPAFEGEVGQENKRQLLESIRALIESKAEVK